MNTFYVILSFTKCSMGTFETAKAVKECSLGLKNGDHT